MTRMSFAPAGKVATSNRVYANSAPAAKIISARAGSSASADATASSCACGGGCPRCQNKTPVQTELRVSQPGDTLESEADRVADQVMRVPQTGDIGAAAVTERPGYKVSRHSSTSASAFPDAPPIVHEVLQSPGRPLDDATRRFFEPRFGRDFSDVHVHTDARAAESARGLNAAAYAAGGDLVFGAGRYTPGTTAGRRLLAHELSHVIQQSSDRSRRVVQRTVDPTQVHCTPNVHNAVDDPVAALTSMDDLARERLRGASNALFLASFRSPPPSGGAAAGPIGPAQFRNLFGDPSSGRTEVLDAYHRRFGPPQAVSGGFRNRFSGAVLPTIEDTESEELRVLSGRLLRMHNYLNGTIRYSCRPQNGTFTVGGCPNSRCQERGQLFNAVTCAPTDRREIALCPVFWDDSPEGGALTIIHESVHMLFNIRRHPSATAAQRGRNPECYASFVADLYGLTPSGMYCDPVGSAP